MPTIAGTLEFPNTTNITGTLLLSAADTYSNVPFKASSEYTVTNGVYEGSINPGEYIVKYALTGGTYNYVGKVTIPEGEESYDILALMQVTDLTLNEAYTAVNQFISSYTIDGGTW